MQALCLAGGVDAQCTDAALAALEREGGMMRHGTSDKGSDVAPSPTVDHGVDFRQFVAAVRATLLYAGEFLGTNELCR